MKKVPLEWILGLLLDYICTWTHAFFKGSVYHTVSRKYKNLVPCACEIPLWCYLDLSNLFTKEHSWLEKYTVQRIPRRDPLSVLSVNMFVCLFAFFKCCVSLVVQNVLQDTRNFLRRNYTRWFGPLATALAQDRFFKVVIKNEFWDWPILVVASLFLSLVCIVEVAGIYNINTKTINIPRKSKEWIRGNESSSSPRKPTHPSGFQWGPAFAWKWDNDLLFLLSLSRLFK